MSAAAARGAITLLLIAGSAAAADDTVLARDEVELRAQAAPHARVVVRAPAGARLHVLQRKKEWIDVEAGRRHGWVRADRVRAVADAKLLTPSFATTTPAAPTVRREAWVTASKFNEADFAERTVAAEKIAAWDHQRSAGAPLEIEVAAPTERAGDFMLSAQAGVAVLSRRFTSNGTLALSNYQFSVDAAAVRVAAGYQRRLGRHLVFGLDGAYDFAGGSALRYPTSSGALTQIGVAAHVVDGGLAFGVRSPALGGLTIAVRAGGRMLLHLIEVKPEVKIPSDRLIGLTVGLFLDAPAALSIAGRPLGLHLAGVALVAGQRVEAPGLEDGTATRSYGGLVDGGLSLGLAQSAARGSLSLHADYAYHFDVTHFSGASPRDPAITVADLGSAQHLIVVGLAYAR